MKEPTRRDLRHWLNSLPLGLGKGGLCLFLLGLIVVMISVGASYCDSLNELAFLAVGLASISVGIGLISVGAAYKSDTQMKSMDNSEASAMSEPEKNDMEIIKTSLTNIDGRLKNIEEQIGKIQKAIWRYSGLTLGVASMAAGITLLVSSPELAWAAVIMFFVGLPVSLLAIFAGRRPFDSRK